MDFEQIEENLEDARIEQEKTKWEYPLIMQIDTVYETLNAYFDDVKNIPESRCLYVKTWIGQELYIDYDNLINISFDY